ncbi:hypothetical protein PTKIN_Ptkin14bG0194300 [Pterospermum kingtungense]
MDSKAINYKGSLPVPCVQELAKELTTIPSRYVRSDLENLRADVAGAGSMPQIPVIDMERLVSEDQINADSELTKLDFACREWGFFQLVNHGVSCALIEKLKREVEDLFNLPMEEKKKLWQQPGDIEGFGQAFVMSEEQKLDWGDLFFMSTLPPQLRKPHLFSNLPLPFRETLDIYSLELKNLAMTMLSMIAKALNMKAEEMEEFFGEGKQSMRMNYYPPCPQPDQAIGLTPHSDSTGVTILLQVNEVDGLQVKKDGMWVPIKPLPNAFIVNIGDILEIITNGEYRSIEHRAMVNLERERLSIATFYGPSYDGEIGPAPSLISPQKPPLFRRVQVEEYFRGRFARKLQGKTYLDAMRI